MERVYRWLPVPALVLLVGVYLVPLGQVLLLSVTDPQPGLENYALLFNSASIARVAGTTLSVCAMTTGLAVVLGYLVAYAMTQASAGWQRLMLACVLLPLWVSVLARAFAWVTLLRREGILNGWLMGAGLITQPLPLMWNQFGVVVGMVHYMLPFAILPLASHMRGLGASRSQAFARVFLPLSLPGVVGAGGLVLIFSLGFYVTPVLLGGGRVMMVAEYISLQIQEMLRWGVGTMLATALVLVIGLVMLVLSKAVGLRSLTGAR
jgi:putative spermidine/putrescine transport system permease protein